MRPGAFVPIKWRLPECMRLILPFAVILKRFLAPRWVFNFNFGFDAFLGIARNPLNKLLGACFGGRGQAPPSKTFAPSILRVISPSVRGAGWGPRGLRCVWLFFGP